MQGQPAAMPASHRVSSHCLGAFPCTVLENHVQRARGSFVFYFPGGIEGSGVPVVLTQHVSSATHESLYILLLSLCGFGSILLHEYH